MSAPLCVVVGAGRVAAGHVAPLLRAAGWDVVLVTRDDAVAEVLRRTRRVVLDVSGADGRRVEVVDGVDARLPGDRDLPSLVTRASLVAVSVGPGALGAVGRDLAPLLLHRLLEDPVPLNVLAFENHRRAAELLADGLVRAEPILAAAVGRLVGIAGAAVWRVASHRSVTPDGLRLRVDDVAETFVDAGCLVPEGAPADGSVPGLRLVEPFDAWMTDKLWVFNAGHAAAAYLGALAGASTVAEAMSVRAVADTVEQVLVECRYAVAAAAGRQVGGVGTSVQHCLDRYRDPAMADPVVRVARDPRRKLGAGDRIIGPAVAAMGAGVVPEALAETAAAALLHTGDAGAVDLRREVDRDGPAEVLATVSDLDPTDEVSRMVCAAYDRMSGRSPAHGVLVPAARSAR